MTASLPPQDIFDTQYYDHLSSFVPSATDSRFRMEVHMDCPDKMGIHAKKICMESMQEKFHGSWNQL